MKIAWFVILPLLFCFLSDNVTATKKKRQEREVDFFYFKILQFLPKAGLIYKEVLDLWNRFLRDPNLDIKSALFRSKEHEMVGRFLTITSKISNLEREIGQVPDTIISTILQAFPKLVKLELNINQLKLIINQINFADEQIQSYLISGYNITAEARNITSPDIQNRESLENDINNWVEMNNMPDNIMKREADPKWTVERYTLENFAAWATGHSFNSLMSLLRRLNDLITEKGPDGIFNLIQEFSQEIRMGVCNLQQSSHQTLYNLYNSIALAELKGNTILQFSYMILKMYDKGNFTTEAQLALQNYENYARQEIEVVKNALSVADRSIYKCDPKQYVEGVTYTKLTKLLQGYIENEVNLNPYGTCRENCAYYVYTEYNGCFKNQFCAHQPQCKGKVIECRYVDSDMDICVSSNPDRRYEWVEYENGKIMGNKGVCEKRNLFKVDSWWRYLFWHCSYCLCLCDDSNRGSDRYFNLRDVTSDIEENKVVTGVRIVKRNQIIHIQIQQGILTPLGIINKTSLSWKPVDNYTVDDDNVENNVDYHTMTWLERAIDTDEVFGPPEHVVTGLRFRKIGTHLNLEVRVTPINFTTGTLFKADHSYWLGNDNTDISQNHPRSEIQLTNPDIPIRNGPHTLNSKHDQYIQFQSTSFETDAAQNTVPYLDSQALTSQGFPLSGIGLIHRGKSGSGGFIAPKLISYDFTPHLRFD